MTTSASGIPGYHARRQFNPAAALSLRVSSTEITVMRNAAFVLFLATLAACAEAPTQPVGTAPGTSPEAAPPKARTVRIIVYAHGTNPQTFITVNASHPGLADAKGRLAIALGRRTQGFKVLDDVAIDRLLASLTGKGFDADATEFVPGDEALVTGSGSLPERFRGTVYVELDGVRRKLVGVRPNGRDDQAGQERLRRFTEIRMTAITFWDMKGQTDYPNPNSATGSP